MDEKRIVFWLHRVLEEKCHNSQVLLEEISVLNHQCQNFEKMNVYCQKQVVTDLLNTLGRYGWDEAITEIKLEEGVV